MNARPRIRLPSRRWRPVLVLLLATVLLPAAGCKDRPYPIKFNNMIARANKKLNAAGKEFAATFKPLEGGQPVDPQQVRTAHQKMSGAMRCGNRMGLSPAGCSLVIMVTQAPKQPPSPAALRSRPRHGGGLERVLPRYAAVARHPPRFRDANDAIALARCRLETFAVDDSNRAAAVTDEPCPL